MVQRADRSPLVLPESLKRAWDDVNDLARKSSADATKKSQEQAFNEKLDALMLPAKRQHHEMTNL
jgi:hypothetical protein